MMQFTESFPPPHQIPPFPNLKARAWPGLPPPKQLSSFGDANCMEQLLVHCATAIETNDATLAQQILWVLNNIAPPDGDSSQRLTCAFLRALIARAARSGSCKLRTAVANVHAADLSTANHKFSIIELAGYVDLTPWHRFGFTAANAAVIEAVEGHPVVHIVDFSLTHCMQIPTLIDAIASRLDGPPLVKLTVAGATEDFPPMLDLSYEELGLKLVNFARSRNVAMEFRVIPSSSSDGFSSLIEQLRAIGAGAGGEALVINCQMMLHYIPEETLANAPNSLRAMFLKAVRGLNPRAVVVVDEDADFTSGNLVSRLRAAYNYLWIPYDTVETFLPRESRQRQWYEADMWWKIENVIAQEGPRRVERLEPREKWVQRMRGAGFRGAGFSDDAVAEVKSMLDEHAAGWGMKKEEQDLVLTWKGHNVVFATAWMPA
ncbi:scarecrow-like protein 32 [Salvia miltiorrhiza]|uniref:scarecrow-like protein 32 n=1 Tax=Salvia miltiorrhiza TaxID=226208 RepID=UPI0025AB7AC3|nr:scarecrow-like protein 32 [Salvia miltiorrhiza]